MKSELALEQRCRELIGQKIENVQYYGTFEIFENAHSVSRSVYIFTSDRRIHRFGFEDEFSLRWGFGISVKSVVGVFPKDDEEQLHEVQDLWKQRIDSSQIADVRLHWRYIEDSHRVLFHSYGRNDYPQDLELILENGKRIFIGVTRILEGDRCKLFTNHLTVFFDPIQRERMYKDPILWQ